MTPYMASLAAEAKLNQRTTWAWQTASYTRAKKLPALKELLVQNETKAKNNSMEFKQFLMMRSSKNG